MQSNITKMWLIISSNTTPVEIQMKFTICHIEGVSYFQRFKKHIAILWSRAIHVLPMSMFCLSDLLFTMNKSFGVSWMAAIISTIPAEHKTRVGNLTMFECCFLISKYHDSCNAMSSFIVICHVPWNTFTCCAA